MIPFQLLMAARRERPWWEPDCAGGNGVNDSASDGGASSDVHPKFPSLRMPSTVIYKYFTVISDKLGLSSTARLPLYIG